MTFELEKIALLKARCAENWRMYNCQFYYAGCILLEEFEKGNNLLRNSQNGEVLDKLFVGQRIHLHAPPRFCLAFSVELLVKAVLIKQDPERWIPETGKIKFGHKVNKLIKDNIRIDFAVNELEILDCIDDFVMWGKYPERVNPGDIVCDQPSSPSFHPYRGWNPAEFKKSIDGIRAKLDAFYDSLP